MTPSGPLTARDGGAWRSLEGSECRDRRRDGAPPAAAAAANSTGGPVAGRGSRLGTAPQRPLAGTLDCSQAGAGAADRAGPAALRNGVDGHLFGFRGVPWSTPAGLEGPLGAAERATVTPSGPLTARRRCLPVVEGSECRDHRRDGAAAATAAANSWREPRSAAARQQRSIPPRSRRRAGREPSGSDGSRLARSRSIGERVTWRSLNRIGRARPYNPPLSLGTRKCY